MIAEQVEMFASAKLSYMSETFNCNPLIRKLIVEVGLIMFSCLEYFNVTLNNDITNDGTRRLLDSASSCLL